MLPELLLFVGCFEVDVRCTIIDGGLKVCLNQELTLLLGNSKVWLIELVLGCLRILTEDASIVHGGCIVVNHRYSTRR